MQYCKQKAIYLILLMGLSILALPSTALARNALPAPTYGPQENSLWNQTEYDKAVSEGSTEKWIYVDLSEQMVVAYKGREPVRWFRVSTGRAATPTVTGTFRIWTKTPIQDMSGGSAANGYYYLEDVQWAQYFYGDYGFHGTYWHDNFGTPMSSGCVNMTNEDAEWLFKWTGPYWSGETQWLFPNRYNPGTLVVIQD